LVFLLLGLTACGRTDTTGDSPQESILKEEQIANHAVAADVLFLVLGKMALYDQSPAGDISFNPEGNAFLAHGARVLNPEELHRLHPDGEYYFSYQTQSGRMERQTIKLQKRDTIERMPLPAAITLSQNGSLASPGEIDPDSDLSLGWESMPGNTRVASSDLDDLIFVLVFDCFGDNVAHSGRPYQGGTFLTYRDSQYVVDAASLEPGQIYKAIVEQATADVTIFQGVPGIATYATLTFLEFQTSGVAEGKRCQ